MGDLIAAAPGLPSDPPREKITEFMPTCIKLVNNGNVNAFVRLVGVNKYTVYSWLAKKPVPQTDLLLKVCYRLGLSLTDLLTKDQVFPDLELINHSLSQMGNITSRLRHKTGEVRRLLQAALEQDPPLSVREVAQHLGYKHVQFLRLRYPDLCKMLTARYRESSRHRNQTQPSEKSYHDDAALKRALQQALKEEVPTSLNEIAKHLGYATTRSFRTKFTDLCEAIIARRAECRAKHRNTLRLKLKAILLEDAPRTLEEVTKQLGYKSNIGLSRYYPELCAAIAIRHAECCRAQFEGIRHKLEGVLREEPPPSLRAAAGRLGHAPAYLGEKFPEVCQAIAKRHAEFRKKRSLEKQKQAKTGIRRLALDLHAKGEYPSAKRLNKASNGPIGLGPTELCEFLREVRRELGLIRTG